MKKATLALACGETFDGFACGAGGEAQGEVVFNTSHTGYQEILTDPSYAGQLVTFTVVELGNLLFKFSAFLLKSGLLLLSVGGRLTQLALLLQ